MLPPLADLEDLKVRLPVPLSEDDEPRAEAALADASTLVRTAAGKTWVTDDELDADIPDVIFTVTLAVARRGLLNPDSVRQETLGNHSITYGGPESLYLTDDEKALIAAASAGGPVGIWTLSTTRSLNDLPDIYLEVEGSELIPHVPEGCPW